METPAYRVLGTSKSFDTIRVFHSGTIEHHTKELELALSRELSLYTIGDHSIVVSDNMIPTREAVPLTL